MKRHLTKAEKLRRASKICWLIGAGMTAWFVFGVIRPQFEFVAIAVAVAVIASAGLQYVITLAESALFDGTLPAPWNIDWTVGGPLPWLWCGAIVCLVADVLLNLGGVAMFTIKVDQSTVATEVTGLGAGFVAFIKVALTFAFAILFAVGSELLDEFAHVAETGATRATWARPTNVTSNQPRQSEQRGPEHKKEEKTRDEQREQMARMLEVRK